MRDKSSNDGILKLVLLIVCCGQFLFIMGLVLSGQNFSVPDLSYTDFLTAIFTAVTLILSMLAIMIGVIAFLGWQGFQANVERISRQLIQDGFKKEGDLREALKEEVEAVATFGIASISLDDEEEQEENE